MTLLVISVILFLIKRPTDPYLNIVMNTKIHTFIKESMDFLCYSNIYIVNKYKIEMTVMKCITVGISLMRPAKIIHSS